MAIPFSLSDVFFIHPLGGPFKSGTSFYIVAQDASTPSAIKVLKADSDDPSSGWTEQDSSNRPVEASAFPYQSLHAVLDGTTLHIVSQSGTVADVEYHTFDCSLDTWSVTSESVTTAPNAPSSSFCSIAVRSDGDVIVAYAGAVQANMGTNYDRVDLARRESASWTTDISIDNLGKTTTEMRYPFVVMADQTNDRAHIFYHNITDDDLMYSTYLSGNTFGHQHTSADASTYATTPALGSSVRAISFDDAGTTKVRAFYNDTGGTISAVGFDDADSPGTSISIATGITTAISASHAYAADGNIQHLFYENNALGQLLHQETGAGDDTWSSQTIEVTSFTQMYSANVYGSTLGHLYYRSPNYTYDEFALGGGATTIVAAAGSYALTGVAAGTAEAHKLSAAAGSYAVTGVAANTAQGYLLTADVGAYALTGVDADLLAAYNIIADPGAYALTGVDAGTGAQRKMTAEAGSYALTGVDAALTEQHVVEALAGSYTVTGVDAILAQAHVLTASLGSYSLTGVDAGTAQGFVMAADVGSYTLTGVAAGTAEQHVVTAEVGSYTLTGVAAITSKSGADPVLVADAGAYAVTGFAAGTTEQHVIAAELGTYVLTGVAAGLTRQHVLQAVTGTYNLSGVAAITAQSYVMAAELGTYNLSGVAALLTTQHVIEAAAGAYSLTGVDAITSVAGANPVLTADPGVYALTGQAADLVYAPIGGGAGAMSASWFRRRRR